MSKSPLAGAFAAGSNPEKKKNKKGGALLLIAGIGMTASLGGVFAANTITIASGDQIEFGQGVATTNACDTTLTTSLNQTWATTSGGRFEASSIVVGGIGTGCSNKTIKVALVDTNGATICGIDGATTVPGTAITLTSNAGTTTSGDDGFKLGTVSADSTVTMPIAAGCVASTVVKVAITTS